MSRLTDLLESEGGGDNIDYARLNAVFEQVQDDTIASMRMLVERGVVPDKEVEKGGELGELIASGKLEVLLEAYSDILVRRIRDKL
jgi:hypothetical protein